MLYWSKWHEQIGHRLTFMFNQHSFLDLGREYCVLCMTSICCLPANSFGSYPAKYVLFKFQGLKKIITPFYYKLCGGLQLNHVTRFGFPFHCMLISSFLIGRCQPCDSCSQLYVRIAGEGDERTRATGKCSEYVILKLLT